MRTFPARICRRGRPAGGFTLLELLFVLSLMGLLMFLAVPTFENLLQDNLEQEVNRLSGVIRLLRNEAVLTNTRFRLMVDLDKGGYHVEEQDQYGAFVIRQQPRALVPHAFPESIEIQDIMIFGEVSRKEPEQIVPILIDPSGYVDPFFLHFKNGDQEYTLRVSGFTGKVELLEGYLDR